MRVVHKAVEMEERVLDEMKEGMKRKRRKV